MSTNDVHLRGTLFSDGYKTFFSQISNFVTSFDLKNFFVDLYDKFKAVARNNNIVNNFASVFLALHTLLSIVRFLLRLCIREAMIFNYIWA